MGQVVEKSFMKIPVSESSVRQKFMHYFKITDSPFLQKCLTDYYCIIRSFISSQLSQQSNARCCKSIDTYHLAAVLSDKIYGW